MGDRLKRTILIATVAFLLAGCAQLQTVQPPAPEQPRAQRQPLRDLQQLPQSPLYYVDQTKLDARFLKEELHGELFDHFIETFFSPWEWTASQRTAEEALWAAFSFKNSSPYGENTLPRTGGWWREVVHNAAVESFPSLAVPAIALVNSSLRSMPTVKPYFLDFDKAGEGFPFDYMQNSGLWAGTPVCITHISADKGWYLVETPFAAGWVRPYEVGVVDEEFRTTYITENFISIIQDEVVVRSKHGGRPPFTTHVGTMLPAPTHLDPPGAELGVDVLAPVGDGDGRAVIREGRLRFDQTAPMPLEPTLGKAGRVARELSGKLYGWGNLYENRDCSALIRDYLFPFGVWMPRNSKIQLEQGKVVDLSALTADQKLEVIRGQAKPFITLLGMPGHVMLYIGEHKGEPLVFHSMWGLKTRDAQGDFGRYVVGEAVVTTLKPGEELDNLARPEGVLLERLTTMSILDELPQQASPKGGGAD